MNGLLNVYKPRSFTPLQTIHSLRKYLALDDSVKIGYAGRLDPLASGVLLLMLGDECKRRDLFQGLSKRYRFKVLFGLRTNSLDPLGKIVGEDLAYSLDLKEIDRVLSQVKGNIELKYPLYSSYAIDGVPMHKLARAGLISNKDRPSKTVDIKSIELSDIKRTFLKELAREFIDDIEKIEGNFDQESIITAWKSSSKNDIEVQIASVKVEASSGTYVRSLAEMIGDMLKIPTIAYDIERLSVGNFNIKNSLKV